jgi:NAD(P)-dependent dehydrogenase (short-subunit alcohol dehydrogenase family)
MRSFKHKLAVVMGAASGIGRAVSLQLVARGCSIAACDMNEPGLDMVARSARDLAQTGVRVSTHVLDVTDESGVTACRDMILHAHHQTHIDLLINSAGIAGGNSFVVDDRESWERTFAICWRGVYNCCRVFLPQLIKSKEACLVNISSINGFWASGGVPGAPSTAYSAAKFAVKGFTESLIDDFAANAPHVRVALVLPGLVATDLAANSLRALGSQEISLVRARLAAQGTDTASMGDEELCLWVSERMKEVAPTSPEQAAQVILDGVAAGQWRILIGDDARQLDEAVRADPDAAYGENAPSLFDYALAQRAEESPP